MYLFPNGTDAGLRRTLLRSSETRDPWSGRLPVSSLLPESLSDPQTPNVACCMKTWTQVGRRLCPCPRRLGPPAHHHHLDHANHQQTRVQTTLGWSATPAYTCHKTLKLQSHPPALKCSKHSLVTFDATLAATHVLHPCINAGLSADKAGLFTYMCKT